MVKKKSGMDSWLETWLWVQDVSPVELLFRCALVLVVPWLVIIGIAALVSALI